MLQSTLAQQIHVALQAAQSAGDLPAFDLPSVDAIAIERPKQADHGDFATPVAMQLAKPARRAPRQIAEALVKHLPSGAQQIIGSAEIAGPGFVNLRLSTPWLQEQVNLVLAAGAHYADLALGTGQTAMSEFISANPTGPLTVGHARNAVLGDIMANLLAAAGYKVTREYYFNDGGLQMKNLAESVRVRAIQELGEKIDFPENYYVGEYIIDIARDLLATYGPGVVERDWTFFRDQAVEVIFADIRRTQERLGIHFDVYTNEMSFFDMAQPGNVWDIVERLDDVGATYEADEATWFRATAFGADKDRVLLRSKTASIFGALRAAQARVGMPFSRYPSENSMEFYDRNQPVNVWTALAELRQQGFIEEENGNTWLRATRAGGTEDVLLWDKNRRRDPTYRLPDISYHINKLERGFSVIVDVLGSDHVAQFPDIRAAVAALGHDASRIKVLAYQFVTLVRNGEQVKMSTRRANYVTLDQLIDEVGVDAVRYFLISRTPDTPFDFDLGLAATQSEENPAYYIQYAHARTAGILKRNAPQRGIAFDPTADVQLLSHPSELALIRQVLRLAEVLHMTVTRLEPHHLAYYAYELAASFSAFYRDCHVLDPANVALSQARLKLVQATQIALARSLALMGMGAPEEM
jgi:arginyl-tRNA synthetase